MAGSNFVDYVKIFARSGHGGAGSAHFRREKFVAFGGPDGGDGGKGGSIILQGDRQYWTLIHLKYQRHQFAEDGECGSGARASGKNAKDIIIPVPLGTVAKRLVENEEMGETELVPVGEVTEHGEQLVLLQGGRGGLGNWHFKSATNQTPRYAQPGEEGDEGAFILELKVLADVGLVGFPNTSAPRDCIPGPPRREQPRHPYPPRRSYSCRRSRGVHQVPLRCPRGCCLSVGGYYLVCGIDGGVAAPRKHRDNEDEYNYFVYQQKNIKLFHTDLLII